MRPSYPSGKVVNLEGEELEELIEADRPAQPFAQTQLPQRGAPSSPSSRVPSPAPQSGMRTGPGLPSQPSPGPIHAVRTEPIDPELLPGSKPAVIVPSTGGNREPTASLRKGGDAAAARSESRVRSRAKARRSSAEEIDELLGEVLGSYRILSLIGEGGMGRVYLAEHTKLGRKVALKLLRPEYAVKRDAVSRFFKEAQAVNKIGHENIVDITDFVELESGETFIIMELLQGEDLADAQKKLDQPMPLHRAMQIALQVCDALEAAHRMEIIHRDLKPDNIFLVNSPTKKDYVKLLDFGVAKLVAEPGETDGWQTAAGSVIGTPAYMSPEQASGIPVDPRSDIYSLGAILYEMFTGHPVFRAKSFGEYVVKHMNDEPIPPRNLADAPKIPASLEQVILRCLEKDPNRRYQSVSELRDDLARATATVQTMVHANPLLVAAADVPRRTRRRRALLLALPIVLGVVALAIAAFWVASGLSMDDVTKAREAKAGVKKDPGVGDTEPVGASKVVTAKLRLLTEPRGAEVFRRGDAQGSLGKTPLDLALSNLGEEVEFVFRLTGYQEATEKVIVADNTVVSVALERREGAAIKVTPPTKDNDSTPIGPRPKKIGAKTKKGTSTKVETPHPVVPPAVKTKTKKGPTKINPDDVVDPFAK